MKALTVRQPYATLICMGIKDIENRTKPTTFRGKIFIHASAKWHERLKTNSLFTDDQYRNLACHGKNNGKNLKRYFEPGQIDNLPVSAIIGEVEIIDCVINHSSIWAEKTPIKGYTVEGEPLFEHKPIWNWVLANPVLYEKPILNVKGKLSFWNFDKDILGY